MASRRMVSKSVVTRLSFLRLSIHAKCLYIYLLIHTDDDGVCEAFAILRMLQVSPKWIDELVAAGYVRVLDERELAIYIVDWSEQNTVRKDRYKPSRYAPLLEAQVPGWRPLVDQAAAQDRTGEESKGQSILEQERSEEEKKWFGIFHNISLTQEEYNRLEHELPDFYTLLDNMSFYLYKHSKSYENFPAALYKWHQNEGRIPDGD